MSSRKHSLRPPVGFPARPSRRGWQGTAASIAVHALLVALLLTPAVHGDFTATPAIGGGGVGPAGGGGGGAGDRRPPGERLQFIAVRPAPAPAAAAPDVSQVTPPPPPPSPPAPSVTPATPVLPVAPAGGVAGSGAEGAGAGSGGPGSGPGTGGGTGSGVGTGVGSGVGPGTGGGPGDVYPPTPTQFFLPPLPAPDRIKPYHLIAWFDVDERGSATLLRFNPSRDAGYNRRLREVLLTLRFRPAVRADGTPVRDTVDIHYIF